LLHLASPALPIGGFHFSQGLEHAVHTGWVHDEATAEAWIGGIARTGLATLDLPVLVRLHRAWAAEDATARKYWNAFLLASRETQELRAEDRHLGSALARVLRELEFEIDLAGLETSYANMLALACVRWQVNVVDTLQTYLWTWTENQVLSAVKLVPLGQSAAQRILHRTLPHLGAFAEAATHITDDQIGITSTMQSYASACHEMQYSRLFRS
jgi:urease accessory protein